MMKYKSLIIFDVAKRSDILAIALCKDSKKINPLPNDRYAINCFFHDDKHPSMILDRKNNRYYCHCCKETGNAIDLLMNLYNLKFITSVETLAYTFNISLPKRYNVDVDYSVANKIKNIVNSESYKDLINGSYQKTLKKTLKK